MSAKKGSDIKPEPINLLPHGVKTKKYALKLVKSLKKIVIVGFSLFAVLAVVFVGAMFVLSGRLDASVSEKERLEAEIKALEQTEQRLFLIKDRLGKIEKIEKTNNAGDEIDILADLVDKIPEGVEFKEAQLVKDSADITFVTSSSLYLGRLLSILVGSGSYSRIELLSFNYKPDTLYEIKLGLAK